jgi:hypothetical protein
MGVVVEGLGLPVAQYDAVAEWEAETLDEILEIFKSDEYKEVSNPGPRVREPTAQILTRYAVTSA